MSVGGPFCAMIVTEPELNRNGAPAMAVVFFITASGVGLGQAVVAKLTGTTEAEAPTAVKHTEKIAVLSAMVTPALLAHLNLSVPVPAFTACVKLAAARLSEVAGIVTGVTNVSFVASYVMANSASVIVVKFLTFTSMQVFMFGPTVS